MLTVEKIGGTSMTEFQDVLNNIIIGQTRNNSYYNRIFVVSAYSNVTNWLLEHKKTKEPGIYQKFVKNKGYSRALKDLLKKLLENGLVVDEQKQTPFKELIEKINTDLPFKKKKRVKALQSYHLDIK